MNKEKRQRIGNMEGGLMIAAAGVIDGVQFLFNLIVVIGWIIVPFIGISAWLMFYLWYKLKGINFLDSGARLAITICTGALLEIIPVLNAFPAWTISVAIMFFIVRFEDNVFNKTDKNIETQKAVKRMT
ncbi:MAG: hypothetical protein QGG63_02855 [Candidatus Pacebacteria bacterium]|jgi:CDP-diglyceride synthetase|nr:hypothetical protein [Candidatus Paceibacterota bacterium]|tara:strand:- start:390 stop:776 length:387 start_codon:yes stop_codon:yes gene_type:complete